MRKWLRSGFAGINLGAPAPEKKFVDPLEQAADAAARHYDFTEGERDEYLKLQRRLAGNPALMKKLVRRQRKMLKAARMSPTIKSRR